MLSILAPIYNEEENIPILVEKIIAAMEKLAQDYEIILVNDGSSDGSYEALKKAAEEHSTVKVINLRRNAGQTAAMMAGINYASGDVIIPMDGDLQNDPADIPKLLEKMDEGYDVVSGWRKNRKDNRLLRNFPSRMANRLISWISGVHLHDYGCSLKAYRRDVIKGVRLYGEMHRFIPIYASWEGGKVTEIPVNHYPRVHGESKYGLERIFKVLLDLMLVKFLQKYITKPIYIFGGFGFFCFFTSFLAINWGLYLKFFEATSLNRTPLPLLSAMFFLTGAMSVMMGIVTEIVVRTYFESQQKSVYIVGETLNIDKTPPIV